MGGRAPSNMEVQPVSYLNMEENGASSYSYTLDLLLSCVCAVLFVILLSLDAWNAFKRKAYWFPGQALVLSAPTIQLLSFVDKLNSSVHKENNCNLWGRGADQLFVNTTRVMICVIIGCLLPGMASSSFTTMGSNIGALALAVIVHMLSEVYFLLETDPLLHCSSASFAVLNSVSSFPSPSPSPSPSVNSDSLPYEDYYTSFEERPHFWLFDLHYFGWRIMSSANLFIVIISLVYLLGCAVLASKSIRNIISLNIPSALSCCCNSSKGQKPQCRSIGDHVKPQCRSIGDHVLKCWISVRASQPEHIMARSVFSSFVGLVVTGCIVFQAVDWIQFAPQFASQFASGELYSISRLITLVFQIVFILGGWIIILFRWLTGVMYFSRDLRSLFHCEDFWTRNIVELKADLNAHCRERLFRDKRRPKTGIQESGIVTSIMAIRLYSLILTMALCLQKLMVSLSKACWCLSEIIFRMIRPILFSHEKNMLLSGSDISKTDDNPFFKHKETLEVLRMPGEFAYSLWFANESAFKKVEKHMEEGFKKGKDSSQLIMLKEHRTGDPHDEAAVSVEDEENFEQVGKMSWKMKAVSLIRLMIFYYEDAVSTDIDDAMQAYIEAWPLLDIVDASNPEAKLVSEAADKELDALEDIWNKHLKMKSVERPKYSDFKEKLSELVEEKIKKGQLCQLCEELGDLKLFSQEQEAKALKDKNYKRRFHQSREWMRSAAAKSSVYKTRKALDLDRAHSMGRLKSLLANVIFGCMDVELDKAVIKICNKWAQEGNENAIFNAAFIAGIAQGLNNPMKITMPKYQ